MQRLCRVYFFSLKNDCVRLFEQKYSLKKWIIRKAILNATIIMSEDGKQAELFLPSSDGSLVLDKKASKKAVIYTKGKYTLTKVKIFTP